MKQPGRIQTRAGFSTDYRKKLQFRLYGNISFGFENSQESLYTETTISYKPTDYLVFRFSPSFSKSFTELQYVTKQTYNDADRYVFASLDRKTISASFRINFNLSPDLTLQYWGQPFVASGKYYDHKYITDTPMAKEYTDRFHTYTSAQKTWVTDHYEIDENVDGIIDYNIGKKDFNMQEFLSNLVVRWELL